MSTIFREEPISDSVVLDESFDPVENAVQQFLNDLAEFPGEIQAAICKRLLASLVTQISGSVATKVVIEAKSVSVAEKKKKESTPRKTERAGSATKAASLPRIDPQLLQLKDATDPFEIWHHFGNSSESVRKILYEEPEGMLEAVLQDRRMPAGKKPRGKSRKYLADAIVERLDYYFQHQGNIDGR